MERPPHKGLVISLFVVFIVFACTALGMTVYLPERELVNGFRAMFTTFGITVQAVIGVVGLAVIVVALATAGYFLWRSWHLGSITRSRAKQAAAEALKAEREARLVITVAPAGSQVFAHQINLPVDHEPLHLAPGGVNGEASATSAEVNRWAYYHALHSGQTRHSEPAFLTPPSTAWPLKVHLFDLLPEGRGNLDNIVLGVTVEDTGQQQIISAPLSRMVHVAIGGTSGWGKSEFLRSFSYQVSTAPQPAEVALIDLEAATFTPLQQTDRLRYPIADNERDILAICQDLEDEISRRKELYKAFPAADTLEVYNRLTDDPLPVIALFLDEITVLFENREIERAFKTSVLRARKYGMFAIAGGQSWKATDFDTTIRGQFSTTVHFHAKDKSSSRVLLGEPVAAEIDQVGRAYVVLPGRTLTQIQAPALSLFTLLNVLGSGADPKLPALPDPLPSEKEQQVLDLIAKGAKYPEICYSVWGYKSSKLYPKIDAIVQKYGPKSAGAPCTEG